MKFQPDQMDGVNAISRLDMAEGRIWVHQVPFEASVLVPWRGEVRPWPVSAAHELTSVHFDGLLEMAPELVIFGSGATLRFISAQHHRTLIERRIGFETMDTAAACRTFNVLASEGRKVVAALLMGRAAAPVTAGRG